MQALTTDGSGTTYISPTAHHGSNNGVTQNGRMANNSCFVQPVLLLHHREGMRRAEAEQLAKEAVACDNFMFVQKTSDIRPKGCSSCAVSSFQEGHEPG